MAGPQKWFELPKEQVHDRLWAYIQYLSRVQSYRTKQNLQNMNLYGDYEAMGLAPHSYARSNAVSTLYPKVTFNLIKSMVDTAHNKIAQNRVLPFFLTEDGDWSQQERGKKLNQFIEGLFFETNFYEIAQTIFLDACIFGTGFLHVFDADPDGKGKVGIERVFTEEIRVDDNQAAFASPFELHREKYVARDRLMSQREYKKLAAKIETANPTRLSQNNSTAQYSHDMIPVIESWRLPTSPVDDDADEDSDGVRAVIIENATLEKVPYDKDYFPILPFRWNVRPLGYFGLGIAGQLAGTQVEVNNVLRVMSRGLRLAAVPRMLIPYGSRINPQHITNDPGGLIFHAPGMEPKYLVGPVFPPEFYQWLDGTIQRAYQQVGISELTAQQKKPAGINSGRGLRELTDIQGDRFATVEQRWESFILAAAKMMILKARDIARRNKKGYEVRVALKDTFKPLVFSYDDLNPDDFMMRVWPTNLLPKTPEGKLETIGEMMDKQLLSPMAAKRLLNYPDLESAMRLETAGQDHIHKCIERMIEDGVYTPPAPYHALDYGLQVVHEALLKYEMRGAPDERLDLLRIWLTQAQALANAANPPPQAVPPQGAQVGAPPGVPVPPGMPPGMPPAPGPMPPVAAPAPG